MTNALAYEGAVFTTLVKSFIEQYPGLLIKFATKKVMKLDFLFKVFLFSFFFYFFVVN